MSNENWHGAGMAASVIAAACFVAIPTIGIFGMYGWWGLPVCLLTVIALVSCWRYIGKITAPPTGGETMAAWQARSSKQFYLGLAATTFILLVGMVMPGMLFQ